MIKTNCFAYLNKKGHFKCAALNVENCSNCHFYKTKEQLISERKLVAARKNKLSKGAD